MKDDADPPLSQETQRAERDMHHTFMTLEHNHP
jgi:hypothetical protein